MIFAGSDSEMISKLAKSIAHFFVVQNITEDQRGDLRIWNGAADL